MSYADAAPGWQTEELAEEWIEEVEEQQVDSSSHSSILAQEQDQDQITKNRVVETYGSIKWVGSTKMTKRDGATNVNASHSVVGGNDDRGNAWTRDDAPEVYDQSENDTTRHSHSVIPGSWSGDDEPFMEGAGRKGRSSTTPTTSPVRTISGSVRYARYHDQALANDEGAEQDDDFQDAQDHPPSGSHIRSRQSSQHQQHHPHGLGGTERKKLQVDSGSFRRVFSPSTSINEKISNGVLASSLVPSPPHSTASSSSSRGSSGSFGNQVPTGTVVIKSDEEAGDGGGQVSEDKPAFLRGLRNPFKDSGKGSDALFEPLALEKMFIPPRPLAQVPAASNDCPEKEEERGIDVEHGSHGSVRSLGSGSIGLYAQARRPPLANLRDSPDTPGAAGAIDPGPRRASHQYAPRQPSGLSNSITPPSHTSYGSMSSSVADSSTSNQQADDELGESSSSAAELQSEREQEQDIHQEQEQDRMATIKRMPQPFQRQFSGQESSMQDVEFSFSPPRATPSPPSQQRHMLATVQQAPFTPKSQKPFKLFQLKADTFTKSHLSELVESISINGTPVSVLASRHKGRHGDGTPVRPRKASSSPSLSADRYRRRQRQRQSEGSQDRNDEDDREEEGSDRSAKRIRLSGGEDDFERYPRNLGEPHADNTDVLSPPISRLARYLPPTEPRPAHHAHRTSWGERGEDLLERIRLREFASPSVSASSISRDTPSSTSSAGFTISHDRRIASQAQTTGTNSSNPTIRGSGLGTQNSHPSSGTQNSLPSSGSGTITSQYASDGQYILDRIKERKVSESSGVGTGTDDREGRERILSDGSNRLNERRNERDDPHPKQALQDSSLSDADDLELPEHEPENESLQRAEDLQNYALAPSTMDNANSASFVKHKGPPPPVSHGRAKNVRYIAPTDLPNIPEQVGKMMFDRNQMRWVKAVSTTMSAMTEGSSNSSGDIFEGIDSFRDSRVDTTVIRDLEVSKSEQEVQVQQQGQSSPPDLKGYLQDRSQDQQSPESVQVLSTTPASVLKKKVGPQTPANLKSMEGSGDSARRSVSFSDGKKSGKMRDILERNKAKQPSKRLWRATIADDESSKDLFRHSITKENDEDHTSDHSPSTPSRLSHSSRFRQLGTSTAEEVNATPTSSAGFPDTSLFARLRGSSRKAADATFLTECSFTVAHDKLVEIITEVQPFEPHWEMLSQIDLSKRGVTSLARLKEFLPILDAANLNDNEISYLSGIPSTIRKLFVAGNHLSSLTAVNHLANLQILDVSRNDLDSVNQLNCLKHLRELRLDHNRVSCIEDIMGIDSLVKISCVGNELIDLDLTRSKWDRLEVLDLSNNKIERITGLETLKSLHTLNLQDNDLQDLQLAQPLSSVRILKVSRNHLTHLNLADFPRLRTLYADGNEITHLGSIRGKPNKIETLSMRNQRVKSFRLMFNLFPNVRRLYISGNDLSVDFFPSSPIYTLNYLEATACKMTRWPINFGAYFANLRYANLNYNLLPDLEGFVGLGELKKLSMLGNRLGCDGLTHVIEQLRTMPMLEELDVRMNPCTLHFYLPVMIPGTSTSAAGDHLVVPTKCSIPDDRWNLVDANFRQGLPDEWYCKRMTYRALVTMACPRMSKMDGLILTEGEMKKARRLIEDAISDGEEGDFSAVC